MDSTAPTILRVELAGGAASARRTTWRSADRVVDAVGRYGGSALALGIVREAVRGGERAPLVLAAGSAVERALPTAARACVATVAPLTGRYSDGHVGGTLGAHVAAIAPAIAISGVASGEGAVLVVGADGSVAVEQVDGLATIEARERLALLRARFPGAALLAAGPAGDAGVPYATLANEAEPPSSVGRGGMGAALARHGLRAIAVLAPARARAVAHEAGHPRAAVLLESARLRARAAGGTFESRAAFASLGVAARAEPVERKGCRGCPTPCGFVFERPSGAMGARASAIEALLAPLGLASADDALALLERCDAVGVDAKEVGASLALCVRHAEQLGDDAPAARALRGDAAAIRAAIDAIPARAGIGARIAGGTARLARELGVEAPLVRGQAARAGSDLASLLGQCVSTRGADPMRTFAFLAADVPDRARVERLIAPWPLPAGADDPRDPAGKGRLVAWTEAFQSAVDASGFCAFSAAALIADGVLELDELAEWIAPDAVRATLGSDGRALLAAGASIALVQRDLDRALGARAADDRPAFAAELLASPGMAPEYARFRGLDADGAPTSAAWAAAGTRAVLELFGADREPAAAEISAERPVARGVGRVRLRAQGPLLARLGGTTLELALPLPAGPLEVLCAAADARPDARDWLVRAGAAVPLVSRRGARLGPAAVVEDGDELDLVVALSGG